MVVPCTCTHRSGLKIWIKQTIVATPELLSKYSRVPHCGSYTKCVQPPNMISIENNNETILCNTVELTENQQDRNH